MKRISYERTIPIGSIIKDQDFMQTDYEDAISIEITSHADYSVDYLATLFFTSSPAWVRVLLKLRNAIVRPFGLETGDNRTSMEIGMSEKYEIGENVGLFKLNKRSENELVMEDKDKHLNFRTSVLVQPGTNPETIKITSITIVKYNKLFGKIYFTPVKPFHKLIIKTLLKTLSKRTGAKRQ